MNVINDLVQLEMSSTICVNTWSALVNATYDWESSLDIDRLSENAEITCYQKKLSL